MSRCLPSHVRQISAVGLALSLGACVGAESVSELDTGEVRATVIGGVDSPSERDAVVFLRVLHSASTWNDCSGTLVAPRVVVTARHCVTHVRPGTFMCRGNGELVQDGTGAGVFGADLEPSSIEVHVGRVPSDAVAARGSVLFTTRSASACRDDVAALVLDSPIELPSYAPIRWSRPTEVGERLRLVGYGPGEREGVIARREVNNARVVDIAGAEASDDGRATTPRRSLVVAGNTLCSGDSGGPALSMETGALVGVYSRVTGDCFAVESRNTFMLAPGFTALFEAAFSAAGVAPHKEDEAPSEPAAAGGGGRAGAEDTATGGSAGSGSTPANIGGAGEVWDVSEPSAPSDAFRCGVARPAPRTASPLFAVVALLVLGLSRRSNRPGACADA